MQFNLPQIGITIFFNFSQPLKANSEIVSIGYGNSTASIIPSEVQPSNKYGGITFIKLFLSSDDKSAYLTGLCSLLHFTVCRLAQFWNVRLPIPFKDLGNITDSNFSQFANAPSPMYITEYGISIDTNELHKQYLLLVDYQYYTL